MSLVGPLASLAVEQNPANNSRSSQTKAALNVEVSGCQSS